MNNLLPELHEGHAPITLHLLFRDALEAYDDWAEDPDVPVVYHLGMPVSIGVVFDHMRDCTDILPQQHGQRHYRAAHQALEQQQLSGRDDIFHGGQGDVRGHSQETAATQWQRYRRLFAPV